jgi:hypothetical protein
LTQNLSDLAAGVTRAPSELHKGRIASTPGSLDEKVTVTVDGQPGFHRGPCPWTPRLAAGGSGPVAVSPVAGDPAWVQRTAAGEWVVVCWWPDD